jgi:hypothetical protein
MLAYENGRDRSFELPFSMAFGAKSLLGERIVVLVGYN